MGIPKFFRFMSERYPLISQLIEGNKIPEFDNLYLDMNGIIHNCSHPNDDDASFRQSEAALFLAIFAYIEHLFSIIKPKKFFFMAIDGVAPRAKMNQQRSRRFRTAKEAKETREKALRKGEVLPEEDAFDSNAITPGTPFMTRLSLQLKYFVAKKITEDSTWRDVTVVLSGHDVPGEGEHKIMEYIRLSKAQPGYNPNTRHCLYGLDADLIMLGLVSHDPHFCLLREEVQFGPRKKAKGSLESQNFFLLHLSLFREYLDLEFQDIRSTLPFEYSLECIIDDFILLNIFVGNDFLPHLPHLHINEGALNLLFGIYKRILPSAGGYLNEAGTLRVDRLEMIIDELKRFELEKLKEEFGDANWLNSKKVQNTNTKAVQRAKAKGKMVLSPGQKKLFEQVAQFVLALRQPASKASAAPKELVLPSDKTASQADRSFLQDLVTSLHLKLSFDDYDPESDATHTVVSQLPSLIDKDDDEDDDGGGGGGDAIAAAESAAAVDCVLKKYQQAKVEGANSASDSGSSSDIEDEYRRKMHQKIEASKKQYYKEKMGLDSGDKKQMHQLAYRYVEGLQWVLHYYYGGVASWGWFYDYHYAPRISDLNDIGTMKFSFDLGKPFKPFAQLMGVLPSLSKMLVPEAFRDLMTDPTSPLIDFYPLNFEADLNGKKQDWEAVVKIPFIEEKRLLDALERRDGLLSPEEKFRNSFGPTVKFSFDANNEYFHPSSLPGSFPDILHSKAKILDFHLPTLDGLHLVQGLCDGVHLGVNALAGFPSIKTLPHFAQLGHHGVSVFQSESRNDSMIIHVENTFEGTKSEDLAAQTIGQRTFIGWPYLTEALVVGVSDELFRYEMASVGGTKRIVSNPHTPEAANAFRRKAERIEQHYSRRYGVIIGKIDMLLHVRTLKGLLRLQDSSFIKEYELSPEKELDQALQLSVPQVVQEDERYLEKAAIPVRHELPAGTKAFFLGKDLYGTPACVVGSVKDSLAIELAVYSNQAKENAALRSLIERRTEEVFYPSHVVAKMCGLHGLTLAKVTSSMLVQWKDQKVHVGLNLKFEAKSQKVLGYSRKNIHGWEYSDRAVALIKEFKNAFPEIMQRLENNARDDLKSAQQFFGPDPNVVDGRMKELKQWIKEKGVRDLEAVPLFAESLGREVVQTIEGFTERLAQARSNLQGAASVKRMVIKGIPRMALIKPNHAPFRLRGQKFGLGDRVVVVQDSGNVPLAARGVVVGINTSNIDVVFDVPFLSGSTLSGRCSPYRGGTVSFHSALNLSMPQFVTDTTKDFTIEAAKDPLERTLSALNGLSLQGSSPSNGHAGHIGGSGRREEAAGGRRGAVVKPPSTFTPAPQAARGRGRGGPVRLLQRQGPPHATVTPQAPFAGVAAGRARPSEAQARAQANVNPHLAVLNAGLGNGHAGRQQPGRGRGGRGGHRGGHRGGRGGARPPQHQSAPVHSQ